MRVAAFFLALATIAAAACSGDILAVSSGASVAQEPLITALPRALTAAEQQIVTADNDFAFALLRELAAESSPDSNIFISPLSVAMVLGMTYNGAAGVTQAEMQQTLALQGMTLGDVNQSYQSLIALLRGLDPQVTFTLANSVWFEPGFTLMPAFVTATKTYFDATVRSLDFTSPGAVDTLNDWVSKATNGRITDLLQDPDPYSTVAVLLNAIYFNGKWRNRFDPGQTTAGAFTLRSGATVSAQMMTDAYHPAYGGCGPVVDLPYGGDAFRMTIVLPATALALDTLVAGLTSARWDQMVSNTESTTPVDLRLPKFTFSYGRSLVKALKALGMPSAFCDAPNTDFSNLSPGFCVSDVMHKAFVAVDENGTEAAAATGGVIFLDF